MLISVVIPTYHRNDLLAQCLNCLAPGAQSLNPSLYEVLVTDDGQHTTAREMLERSYPWAQWVKGPRRGPAANRNNGARYATGKWIAFVDDDCLPDAEWLKAIASMVEHNPVDVVEGRTIIPDKVDNPFREGVENHLGGNYWSCNLAVRREVFFEVGAFDEDFLEAGGEDMEFAHRIVDRGLQGHFVPEALVLHPTRIMSFRKLLWRTFMIRWFLLYLHKTGQAAPLTSSPLTALMRVTIRQCMDLLRTTYHLVSRPEPTLWRSRLFFEVWKWLTLPVVLPYLLIWELRFRAQLVRQHSSDKFSLQ